MSDTTAFLIFKDMAPYIEQLNNEETGILFKALFEYCNSKHVPELPRPIALVFITFKSAIDKNEERYKKRCEKNKANIEKRYNKEKPIQETLPAPEQKQKGIPQKNLTPEQTKFYEDFQKFCPSKAIDCKIAKMKVVDYEQLLKEIKQSKFLQTRNNLGLKWCLSHASEILTGKYQNFEEKQTSTIPGRQYSKEEYRNLIQPIDEIEI